jgi:DNA anti-recombination protein RmuC
MADEPSPRSNIPIPDPTLLTTQQLVAAIGALKELVFARIDGIERNLEGVHDSLEAIPGQTGRQVDHLRDVLEVRFSLQDEKFRSIATQFTERDVRTEQTSRDSKVAIDAALQAAKESVSSQNESSSQAISKSEAATNKNIDQLGTLINSTTAGLNDKIDDIKDRLTRIEGVKAGGTDVRGSILAGFGALMLLLGLLVAAWGAFHR